MSYLTHLYLSPHFDDAALSCGGTIHQQTRQGERAVVVTVCAGDSPPGPLSAFAQTLHARWSKTPFWGQTPADAVAIRQAEDLAALRILGAEATHLDVPDCIYRVDPAWGEHLYASESAIFGELSAAETGLVQQTASTISALSRQFGDTRLYVPFGLGHHVDHQLTRRAAELVGGVYAYYEDYPYAERDAVPAQSSLSPELVPLEEADLAAKIRAIAAYASQISSFWPDEAAMAAALSQFAGRVGGGRGAERLWRPA